MRRMGFAADGSGTTEGGNRPTMRMTRFVLHEVGEPFGVGNRPKRGQACGLTAMASCRQGHRCWQSLRFFGQGRQVRRRGRSRLNFGFRRGERGWRWVGWVRWRRWLLFRQGRFRFRRGHRKIFRDPKFRGRRECLCYQVLGSCGVRDRYGSVRGLPDLGIRGGGPGPNRKRRARRRPRQLEKTSTNRGP